MFLNQVLKAEDKGIKKNYMQLFTNDGTKRVNPMKIRNEQNCKARFRNLDGDAAFHFRIEYKKPRVSLYWFDSSLNQFEMCGSIEQELDFNGIFMITGASGLTNPDHIFIDSLAMYDPGETVSEGHNEHVHEVHKKKAIHDMAQFNIDHHAKDLLHNKESFFNKG